MRHFLKYAFLLAAISVAPAYAQVQVKPIRVMIEKVREQSTIEVEIENKTAKIEKPKVVVLLIREKTEAPWRALQTWKVQGAVKPGKSMKFVYHVKPGKLDPALKGHEFQVRAKVDGVDSFISSVTGA